MKKSYLPFIVIILLFNLYTNKILALDSLKNKFHIGYHHFFYAHESSGWRNLFGRFRDLQISLMINAGNGYENGTAEEEGWNDGSCGDFSSASQLLSMWEPNNALFMEREKIKRGAYGQLSDYQAEIVGSNTRPKYGYDHRRGYLYSEMEGSENISGITTYPDPNISATGFNGYYLLWDLIENREQTNDYRVPVLHHATYNNNVTNWDDVFYTSDVKVNGYKWFVLPRMRISEADAHSSTVKQVCRITIIKYNGHDSISYDINTNNFRKADTSYHGEYIENYFNPNGTLKEISIRGDSLNFGNHNISSKVDYRIFWYGQVHVWVDRVRVADEWARSLFYPDIDSALTQPYYFKAKIKEEMSLSCIGSNSNFGYAYMDEYNYSSIPCIAKVNEYIKNENQNSGLICETNVAKIAGGSDFKYPPLPEEVLDSLVSKKAVRDVLFAYNYTFTYKKAANSLDTMTLFPLPNNITLPNKILYPGTIGYYKSANPSNYNDSINYWLEHDFQNGFGYNYCYLSHLKRAAKFQKDHPEIIFAAGTQIHSYENPFADLHPVPEQSLREPTNEEVKLQDYLALCYGAKAILQYSFYSTVSHDTTGTKNYYAWGMKGLDTNDYWTNNMRDTNYYGQRKFETLAVLNNKLKYMAKIMYEDNKLKWDESRTINRDVNGANFKFISGLNSYYRDPYNNWNLTSGNADIKKYWEIGAFTNETAGNDGSTYFMLVNKRCTPEINSSGDVRTVRLSFNASDPALAGFNNWKITNAGDSISTSSVIFDKNNSNGVVFPEEFMPGEAKLLKLTPVMKVGGTLAGNELVSGMAFNCLGTVYNAGYNIKLTGVTINFDSTAGIKMNSGKLQIGNITSENFSTIRLNLKGMPGKKWNGIECNNSSFAYFNQVDFNDLKDTITVLTSTNTDTLVCQNCRFYCAQNTINHPSGVNIVTGDKRPSNNSFISSIFNMSASSPYAINMASIGANRSSFYMSYVTISPGGTNTAGNGVILSGCNAIIKNSNFTGYMNSIISSSSDIHLLSNYFKSSGTSSALTGNSYSNLYLAANDKIALGGNNIFDYSSYSSSMKNIHIDVSTFDMWGGSNKFYIDTVNNTSNYHIDGTFNYDREPSSEDIDLGGNCFYHGNQASNFNPITPLCNLHDAVGNPISILYEPSPACDPVVFGEVDFIDNMGAEVIDTVYNVDAYEGGGGGGMGSGKSEANKNASGSIANKEIKQTSGAAFKLHSSIEVSYRKHNLDSVFNKCYLYLDTYFDSTGTSNAITRLYSSTAELDKKHPLIGQSRMTLLKSYYEGLILSHSDNEKIVKMLFYYIQKAKIALRDYDGAMSGLQQIMNQNPYSYEGLIASWDYMSAYVQSLDSSGGGGGGKNYSSSPKASIGDPENQNLDCKDEFISDNSDDPYTKSKQPVIRDDFDKKKYNEDQRKQITKSIISAFTKTKKTADDEIKQLKDDADHGSKKAIQLLEEKKVLKESVKIKKPSTNIQLLQILNSDIKKVFHKEGIIDGKDAKKPLSIIPLEYKLNQNYPNPFNPVTKISFEIPNDSKVKLIVYDMLGREVTTLINDETRQAGKYIMEFNGQAFASGVYFYRIVAQGGDQSFVQVKKMVLVK